MNDLVDPTHADLDDLDDDELLPGETEPHSHDPRRNIILDALRELGPATAREIAVRTGRETNNVGTRLRQMEEQGRVRRTGRSTSEPGQRGGPSIEWELMPEHGEPTGPGVVSAPPGPVEERLRAMSEKVGRALQAQETAQQELAAARARADSLEREVRAERDRRERAERQVSGEQSGHDDLRNALNRAGELEAEVTRLRRQAAERPAELDKNPISDPMRERYFDLLLDMAREGGEEHVFDRIERLLGMAACDASE